MSSLPSFNSSLSNSFISFTSEVIDLTQDDDFPEKGSGSAKTPSLPLLPTPMMPYCWKSCSRNCFTVPIWIQSIARRASSTQDFRGLVTKIMNHLFAHISTRRHISVTLIIDSILSVFPGGVPEVLRFGFPHPLSVPEIEEHDKGLKKLDTLMWKHISENAVTTIYDLNDLFKRELGSNYTSRFGPLCELPVVKREFGAYACQSMPNPDLPPLITNEDVYHRMRSAILNHRKAPKVLDEKYLHERFPKAVNEGMSLWSLVSNSMNKKLHNYHDFPETIQKFVRVNNLHMFLQCIKPTVAEDKKDTSLHSSSGTEDKAVNTDNMQLNGDDNDESHTANPSVTFAPHALSVDETQLLNFVSHLPPSCLAEPEVVATMLGRKFGLREDESLIGWVRETTTHLANWAPPVVVSEKSLSFAAATRWSQSLTFNEQCSLLRVDEILSMLSKCPPLEDAKSWLLWDEMMAPNWGDFTLFVSLHAHQVREHNVALLQCQDEQSSNLLRIFVHSTVDEVQLVLEEVLQLLENFTEMNMHLTSAKCSHLLALLLTVAFNREKEEEENVAVQTLLMRMMEERISLGRLTIENYLHFLTCCVATSIPIRSLAYLMDTYFIPILHSTICGLPEEHGLYKLSVEEVLLKCWFQSVPSVDKLRTRKLQLAQMCQWKECVESRFWSVSSSETQSETRMDRVLEDQVTQPATSSISTTPVVPHGPEKERAPVVCLQDVIRPSPAPIAAETSEYLSSGRELVDRIRKEDFGLDRDLDEEMQAILMSYRGRLSRSLDYFSEDIYSQKCHFVYELIQNADDNNYPSGGVPEPTLAFHLRHVDDTEVGLAADLWLYNNEEGFERKDVRALCDIGSSSKVQRVTETTGRKGIGFKSVFSVSGSPEIHSNEFHLRFLVRDASQECNSTKFFGAVVPTWCEPSQEVLSRAAAGWKTQIRLPIDASHDASQEKSNCSFESMMDMLRRTLQPHLLLFLRRLRVLSLLWEDDAMDGGEDPLMRKEVTFMKTHSPTGCVKIWSNRGVQGGGEVLQEWFLHHLEIEKSHVNAQLFHGKGRTQSTTLSVAIPLRNADSVPMCPPQQPLFTYLPLRSYGLRFILNGDLDVTTSREDVVEDSVWNKYLRSKVGEVVDLAVRNMVQRLLASTGSVADRVRLSATILDCLPLPSEVAPFLLPVVAPMLERLARCPFLPSAEEDGGCGKQWFAPCELTVPVDPVGSSKVTGRSNNTSGHRADLQLTEAQVEAIRKCARRAPIHPDILSETSDSAMEKCTPAEFKAVRECLQRRRLVLQALGCVPLTVESLLDAVTCRLQKHDLDREEVPKVLSSVQRLLSQSPPYLATHAKNRLKCLPIFPVVAGDLVSLSVENSSSSSISVIWLPRHYLQSLPKVFLTGLTVLDVDSLFPPGSDVDGVKSLLAELGLLELSFEEIVEKMILPRLTVGCSPTIPVLQICGEDMQTLCSGTRFLCEHVNKLPTSVWKSVSEMMKKNGMAIVCSDHKLHHMPDALSQLYLHPQYIQHDPVALALCPSKKFPTLTWLHVSTEYLGENSTNEDIRNWRHFWTAVVGLRERLLPVPVHYSWPPQDEVHSLPEGIAKALQPHLDWWKERHGTSLTVVDFEVPLLREVLSMERQDERVNMMCHLLTLVDADWDHWKECFHPAVVTTSELDVSSVALATSWLRNVPSQWICTLHREPSIPVGDTLRPSENCFVPTKESWRRLGCGENVCGPLLTAVFPQLRVQLSEKFLKALHIQTEATVAHLKQFFVTLSEEKHLWVQISLTQMKAVYSALLRELSAADLDVLLATVPRSIFLPTAGTIGGRFLATDEVYIESIDKLIPVEMLRLGGEPACFMRQLMNHFGRTCLAPVYGVEWNAKWNITFHVPRYPPFSSMLEVVQQQNLEPKDSWLGTWYSCVQNYVSGEDTRMQEVIQMPIVCTTTGTWYPPDQVLATRSRHYHNLIQYQLPTVPLMAGDFFDTDTEGGGHVNNGKSATLADFLQHVLKIRIFDDWASESVFAEDGSEFQESPHSTQLLEAWRECALWSEKWIRSGGSHRSRQLLPLMERAEQLIQTSVQSVDRIVESTTSIQVHLTVNMLHLTVVSVVDCRALGNVFYYKRQSQEEEEEGEVTDSLQCLKHLVAAEVARLAFPQRRGLARQLETFLRGYQDMAALTATNSRTLRGYLSSHGVAVVPSISTSTPVAQKRAASFEPAGDCENRPKMPRLMGPTPERVTFLPQAAEMSLSRAPSSTPSHIGDQRYTRRLTSSLRETSAASIVSCPSNGSSLLDTRRDAREEESLLQRVCEQQQSMQGKEVDEARQSSGRLGEMLAHRYLTEEKPKFKMLDGEEWQVVDADWVNETAESGLPYDLKLVMQLVADNGRQQQQSVVAYADVKSTMSDDMRGVLDMSVAELEFALRNPGKYHVVRVWNMKMRDMVSIDLLPDLPKLLEQKRIKIKLFV